MWIKIRGSDTQFHGGVGLGENELGEPGASTKEMVQLRASL